jgi:predicted nucleotidyltransferase
VIAVLEKLVEGYFLTTSENLVFEVKGVVHPKDRIIAYLRYIPDSKSPSGFRKIYDLNERESYLKNNFSEYLWFSESHGRRLQGVPHSSVKQVLDPVEHMNQIRQESSALSIATSDLVDLLQEHTGVKTVDVGVTGSQLVGAAKETSDIDLVVFGESACTEFYKRLSKSYDEIPGLNRYQGELLDTHVEFRWGKLGKHRDILRKIESRKILQGIFRTHDFFIRLVRRPEDINEQYGQLVTKNLGVEKILGRITEDRNSIFTPCSYQVEAVDFPELSKIDSYRGRFTEHVAKGDFVKTKGRLEQVIDKSANKTYLRLILGENSSDFLIPQ